MPADNQVNTAKLTEGKSRYEQILLLYPGLHVRIFSNGQELPVGRTYAQN